MNSLNEIWSHKNYRMAIIFSLLILIWMASGLLRNTPESSVDNTQAPIKKVPNVQAQHLNAQIFSPRLTIRAKTEPNRIVQVRSEASGRVESLPITEGARVSKGDVICHLAEEDRALKVQEAEVNLRKAQIDFDGAQRLKAQGYQSQSAIAAAEAVLAQARAALKRQQLEFAFTQVKAPFDGVLNVRHVEVGAFMQRGDICASVIDLDPLVVAGQVSENEILGLQVGALTQVQVAGVQRHGKVRYISRDAQEQTRSFLIEVVLDNSDLAINGGLTASIIAELSGFPAHELSPALLTLDDAGQMGVRILDQASRVQFAKVKIVGDSEAGVWVTGLPEQTLLITVGQEYVAIGEQVSYQLTPSPNKAAEQVGPKKAASDMGTIDGQQQLNETLK